MGIEMEKGMEKEKGDTHSDSLCDQTAILTASRFQCAIRTPCRYLHRTAMRDPTESGCL